MAEDMRVSVPSTVEAGSSVDISVEIDSEIKDFGTLTAVIEYNVGGSFIDDDLPHERSAGGTINQGLTIQSSTNWTPDGPTRNVTISVLATLEYSDGSSESLSESTIVRVEEEDEEQVTQEFGTQNSTAESLSEFYESKTEFFIDNITYDSSAPDSVAAVENSSQILFEYTNPSISVDSGARFVKHELVGSETVRQKIGQEPLEITVDGACFRDTARQIDGLRYANQGTIRGDRFDGSSIDVQFESSSTDPFEDGSAVSLTETNEIFTFTINCTEVL